jgi:hypothetical protein
MPRFVKIRPDALRILVRHVADGYEMPGKQERLLLLFGRKDGAGNPVVTRAVPYRAAKRTMFQIGYDNRSMKDRIKELNRPNSRYLGLCHSHVEIGGKTFRRISEDDIAGFLADTQAKLDMLITIAAVRPSGECRELTKDLEVILPVDEDVSYRCIFVTRHKRKQGRPLKIRTLEG